MPNQGVCTLRSLMGTPNQRTEKGSLRSGTGERE